MRATLVYRDGDRAAVRLTPSWLGRLFGARETVVELERERRSDGSILHWKSPGSDRRLFQLRHGAMIEDALEAVPVAALPLARVVRGEAGAGDADDPPDVQIAKLEQAIRRIRLGKAPWTFVSRQLLAAEPDPADQVPGPPQPVAAEPPYVKPIPMPVPGQPRLSRPPPTRVPGGGVPRRWPW